MNSRLSFRPTLLCLAYCVLAVASASTAAGPNEKRIPVVTRLVKLFAEQEKALIASVDSGKVDDINEILTEDFEVRTALEPGSPVPRADWVKESINEKHGAKELRQMAVHDYGDIAVVSFVRINSTDKTTEVFIIDVWKRNADKWKLSTRYSSPSQGIDEKE